MCISPTLHPQQFFNGEIHDWYRIVLGYSDHLVGKLLDRLDIEEGQTILDPFCGSGTTLVECMKRGIPSVGIDANPSSSFAARVKTNWSLSSDLLLEHLELIKGGLACSATGIQDHTSDKTYTYLASSGMIDRGWISPLPLSKALTVKQCILALDVPQAYKDILMLGLIAEVVFSASNVKFGPELYCGPVKLDVDVFGGFVRRIERIAADLTIASGLQVQPAEVYAGDARVSTVFEECGATPFASVICSPPYPTEHDYTRNSRLELAFLEGVSDVKTLQVIKRQMIRSHTKCIYKGDVEAELVKNNQAIQHIVEQLQEKAAGKSDGFARYYPRVVEEYFGGMKRHLQTVSQYLIPGGISAYVVGDQSSYSQIYIPTAEILGALAEESGFEIVEIEHWRKRWSTSTAKDVDENILFLRRRHS
jgi:hypothetical protein